MRPLLRSSLLEEMAIWFDGGGVALALLTRAPAGGGECVRFDIGEVEREFALRMICGGY